MGKKAINLNVFQDALEVFSAKNIARVDESIQKVRNGSATCADADVIERHCLETAKYIDQLSDMFWDAVS